MKFIMAFIVVLGVGASALGSSQKARVKQKHHSLKISKRKKSRKKPLQVSNAAPKKDRRAPLVATKQTPAHRTVASSGPSSGKGARYVSKYFDKSVYTNTAAGK